MDNIPTDKKLFLSQYRDEVHQTLTLMKLYNQYLIDNNLVAAETDNRRLNALIDELTNDMIILNRNVNKLKEDRYSKTTLEIIKVLRTSINYYEGLDEYLALLSLRLVEMNKRLVTQIRILYSKY